MHRVSSGDPLSFRQDIDIFMSSDIYSQSVWFGTSVRSCDCGWTVCVLRQCWCVVVFVTRMLCWAHQNAGHAAVGGDTHTHTLWRVFNRKLLLDGAVSAHIISQGKIFQNFFKSFFASGQKISYSRNQCGSVLLISAHTPHPQLYLSVCLSAVKSQWSWFYL